MITTFLAIDPSTTRLGWCIYYAGIEGEDFDHLGSQAWSVGSFAPKGSDIAEKLIDCERQFKTLGPWSVKRLICEMPTFHGGTEKGIVAAKQDYTIWLGMVIGVAVGVFGLKPTLYKPQQWKGSVPKSATDARFKRVFKDANKFKLNHDEIDAIMIMHYHLTKLGAKTKS